MIAELLTQALKMKCSNKGHPGMGLIRKGKWVSLPENQVGFVSEGENSPPKVSQSTFKTKMSTFVGESLSLGLNNLPAQARPLPEKSTLSPHDKAS